MAQDLKAGHSGSSPPAGSVPAPVAEPVVGNVGLEADIIADDDGDSALDVESAYSQTTSLTSSIAQYRVEHGRTYHAYKEGSYILPNDELENDRLDLQHHICLITIGDRLFISPAGKDNPLRRVLDAGCGTGIWAMDFADEHPETAVGFSHYVSPTRAPVDTPKIVGVDLSPIQPSFVPPNVSFVIDDLEAEWAYNQPFDFIYMRMLSASIADWPRLFRQALANLTPGGYLELLDPIYPMGCDDGTFPEDSAAYKWSKLLNDAATKLGSSLDSGLHYKQQLIDAGFTNVVETVYKWPMNTWPKHRKFKELGAWSHENIMQGLQALSLSLFTRALGWTFEELEVFLVDVRKDLKNRNMHGYWQINVVYGQKPE